jgi:mannose-6-phosphate isomerase-like protein (cupin superfamily)
MPTTGRAYVLGPEAGQALWFAGALMVVKAAGEQTEGRFALLDQRVGGGYATPLHVHHDEDEAWYLLDGEVTFYCGDARVRVEAGAWVFAPKGVPHAFRVGEAGARMLTFSAPAGFADFVRAAGEPAAGLRLPPPGPLDVERLSAVAARHGIAILGPPPEATDP